MALDKSSEVTDLLRAWGNGDEAARDQLAVKVYDELRRIARRYMKDERAQATLQTTALVNEVYLRLVDTKNVDWQRRAQFFSICAQMMRRILIDAARARGAAKRGGVAQSSLILRRPRRWLRKWVLPFWRCTMLWRHSRKSPRGNHE